MVHGFKFTTLSSLRNEFKITISCFIVCLSIITPSPPTCPFHTVNINDFPTNRGTGQQVGYFSKILDSQIENYYFILEKIKWFYKHSCSPKMKIYQLCVLQETKF